MAYTYVYQEFPKAIYPPEGGYIRVENADEEAAQRAKWAGKSVKDEPAPKPVSIEIPDVPNALMDAASPDKAKPGRKPMPRDEDGNIIRDKGSE